VNYFVDSKLVNNRRSAKLKAAGPNMKFWTTK